MIVHLLTAKTTKRMLIFLFILIGISTMGFRWYYYGANQVLTEDTAWKVTLSGRFKVAKDTSIITVAKPKPSQYSKIISQRFYHPGFKTLPPKRPKRGLVRAKALVDGSTEFLAEYHIQLSQSPILQLSSKPALEQEQRESYLKSNSIIDLSSPALTNLSEFLQQNTNNKTELIHNIFQHCQKIVKTTNNRYDDINHAIKSNKASTLGRAKLMIALSRVNSIPARLVSGFIIDETNPKTPYYWVEIYDDDNHWQPYDPEKGYEIKLPNNYIALDYDAVSLFNIENGKLQAVKYSISEDLDILNVARLEQQRNIFDIFNLLRLDIDTRQTLVILLLLPFCVLLTALIRHVVGLYPYGTFTAPLLALAMVYADMVMTLIIAGIVIFLALIGRAILPKALLRAPRLSLIFTFVALSMVLSVSILDYFNLNVGGSIILLPTIILVAIVDRFYSYMDDAGAHAAVIRLKVTVIIAILCIPILQFEKLGILILTYPEAHFLTAALVLTFASYKGKKLTDHKYLKLLGENKPKKKDKSTSATKTEVDDIEKI